MTEPYSSVLYAVRECYVYRVPPRTSSAGYRAADWGDMEASLWKGRMRIVEFADHCEIRLEDGETGAFGYTNVGELFAMAPYDVTGKSVEPVLDSSRYFVLRVESDGPTPEQRRKAYIGVGVRFVRTHPVPRTYTELRLHGRVAGLDAVRIVCAHTDDAKQPWPGLPKRTTTKRRPSPRRICPQGPSRTFLSTMARC